MYQDDFLDNNNIKEQRKRRLLIVTILTCKAMCYRSIRVINNSCMSYNSTMTCYFIRAIAYWWESKIWIIIILKHLFFNYSLLFVFCFPSWIPWLILFAIEPAAFATVGVIFSIPSWATGITCCVV